MGYLDVIKEAFDTASEGTEAKVDITYEIDLMAYNNDAGGIPENGKAAKRFIKACQAIGRQAALTKTLGGSDNNNFVVNGIDGLVLSCGMNNVHSVNEFTSVKELKAGAELVAALITET
jgi:tripeptide aminopeptidase